MTPMMPIVREMFGAKCQTNSMLLLSYGVPCWTVG